MITSLDRLNLMFASEYGTGPFTLEDCPLPATASAELRAQLAANLDRRFSGEQDRAVEINSNETRVSQLLDLCRQRHGPETILFFDPEVLTLGSALCFRSLAVLIRIATLADASLVNIGAPRTIAELEGVIGQGIEALEPLLHLDWTINKPDRPAGIRQWLENRSLGGFVILDRTAMLYAGDPELAAAHVRPKQGLKYYSDDELLAPLHAAVPA